MKQINVDVTPKTPESYLEVQLSVTKKMLEESKFENNRLLATNFKLQQELNRHRKHFAAIAVEAVTRVLAVSSFFGLMASFVKPEQIESVVFFGSILGLALYFSGYEVDV